MKGHLRLTGIQLGIGRGLNDIRVRRRVVVLVHRVRRIGVLAELLVVTPPGIFVVRSSHDQA